MKKYLVVDQNMMRKPALGALIATDPHTHFVLPDVAFVEMTKTDDWESTLHLSLKQFAGVPARVHVARSINDGLAAELKDIQPVANQMLYRDASKFLREILKWVESGVDTAVIRIIREDPDDHKASIALDYLDHVENKTSYQELVDATKRFIPESIQKSMRNGKLGMDGRLAAIHQIATGLLPQLLAEKEISREKARAFMRTRPLLLRYLLVKAWYCVSWISNGGFDSIKPQATTNEILDQHYVLTGSFFNGLLSEENRVKESFRDLLFLLDRKI